MELLQTAGWKIRARDKLRLVQLTPQILIFLKEARHINFLSFPLPHQDKRLINW